MPPQESNASSADLFNKNSILLLSNSNQLSSYKQVFVDILYNNNFTYNRYQLSPFKLLRVNSLSNNK
eukprot:9482295-Ditylum_brightwellii.AAC.1